MSQPQPQESDRSAAYRGLILGAIVLAILIVSIVKLTHARYAGTEAGKAASNASGTSAVMALDA